MRWLRFLQIKNFFQQGCCSSKPFFVTRFKIAPAHSFEFPQRWLVSHPLSLPPRADWIVNNGPVTRHTAWWKRQLSKRGKQCFGSEKLGWGMARFSYLFRESPEAAKTAVYRLFCVQWPWHLWRWHVVIWAVKAAAHSFITRRLADALHVYPPSPSDLSAGMIGVVRGL